MHGSLVERQAGRGAWPGRTGGDQPVDAIGLNPAAIHALWTLHGLGALDGPDAGATRGRRAALRHPSAGVRRNAVQVLPPRDAAGAIVASALLDDPDP